MISIPYSVSFGFARLSKCALATAIGLIIFATTANGQQPATGRKRVPRLTTDDIVRSKPEPTTDETAKSDEPGQPKTANADDKKNPEEEAWRDRVRSARELAKTTERAAEEAEIRITELRNALGISGQSASERNDLAAQLDRAGPQLTEARATARRASEELSDLLEYGTQKGFSEAPEPKASTEEGKPNEQYYRAKYSSLNDALQDADRRVQLYENRVRDLNQRIRANTGTGDNFYTNQIQQDRDEAQEKLNEAIAARAKAQEDINALVEEARRAGLPPGIFR